jgi:hypothetical protein
MFIIEQDVKKNNILSNKNEVLKDFDIQDNNDFNIEYNANASIKKKKKLLESVKNLSNIEYNEIFNIIQENNCQYSGNNNGIFINLQNVNDEIIDKIFNFLEFIKKKKEELNEKDVVLENIKKDIQVNEIEHFDNNKINNTQKNETTLSDDDCDDEKINYDKYLCFSSDEDNDLENKLSLKKKKNKYTGKNAKLMKSIKDNGDKNKNT